MILLACFILFWIAVGNIINEKARYDAQQIDYDISERRHRELVELEEERIELEEERIERWQDLDRLEEESTPKRRRRTRTIATDELGRTVAQEIIEEELGL